MFLVFAYLYIKHKFSFIIKVCSVLVSVYRSYYVFYKVCIQKVNRYYRT